MITGRIVVSHHQAHFAQDFPDGVLLTICLILVSHPVRCQVQRRLPEACLRLERRRRGGADQFFHHLYPSQCRRRKKKQKIDVNGGSVQCVPISQDFDNDGSAREVNFGMHSVRKESERISASLLFGTRSISPTMFRACHRPKYNGLTWERFEDVCLFVLGGGLSPSLTAGCPPTHAQCNGVHCSIVLRVTSAPC